MSFSRNEDKRRNSHVSSTSDADALLDHTWFGSCFKENQPIKTPGVDEEVFDINNRFSQ